MPITSENAKELQLLAASVRRMNTEEKRLARANALLAAQSEGYVTQSLVRVRIQLDQIWEMFQDEKDPAKLDRLASAQARLNEQERQLSNRPLPGTLRPTQGKSKRHADPVSEPEPAPQSQPRRDDPNEPNG